GAHCSDLGPQTRSGPPARSCYTLLTVALVGTSNAAYPRSIMRISTPLLFCTFAIVLTAASARADETIVFLRHGEKPAAGLGQLTLQGLNRALEVPLVFT